MARRKKESPSEIAAAAGCSKSLASRLLSRGMSRAEIIARVAESRKRKAELEAMAPRITPFAPGATENGSSNSYPSFAESQIKKEFHLAELRKLEVEIKRRQLVPLEPMRSICLSALHLLQSRVNWLPDQMEPEHGRECARALRLKIEHIFREVEFEHRKVYLRHGLDPPALLPLPDPPPARLGDEEQYVAGSKNGELEHFTSQAQWIASPAWMAEHPSIDLQEAFRILKKKRQWDSDMHDLLIRRREWDLPPEVEPQGESDEEPPESPQAA